MEKICTKCLASRDIEEFHKCGKIKRKSQCKYCCNKYERSAYKGIKSRIEQVNRIPVNHPVHITHTEYWLSPDIQIQYGPNDRHLSFSHHQ